MQASELIFIFKFTCTHGNIFNVSNGNFTKDTFKEVKPRKYLVEDKANFNSFNIFSLNHFIYNKIKTLVVKEYPLIVYEVKLWQQKKLDDIRFAQEAKINLFCSKHLGFISIIDEKVEENMKIALKNKVAAMYFNECNNVAFHNLSRNKIATSSHNLTSLLGLGGKLCPQSDRVSFSN